MWLAFFFPNLLQMVLERSSNARPYGAVTPHDMALIRTSEV
jgi:hypothetical protein